MSNERYEIIKVDGGWAYKVGDAVSTSYPSEQSALIHADLAVGTPGASSSEEAAPGAIPPEKLTTETDDGAA